MTKKMTFMGWASALVVLAGMSMSMLPTEAEAQNIQRARLFRGGSNQGVVGNWPPVPTSVDSRIWPPACGVKQADSTPATTCTVAHFGSHPANPLYPQTSGMVGSNFTFNGSGWDIASTATILGNPGFPVLILKDIQNYGVASFGPGLGVAQAGTVTFNATGVDPATLGTQTFNWDVNTGMGLESWKYPPNSSATTSHPHPSPPNHGGMFRYVTGPERYGGTLNLTGANSVFVALTFNPGVATTGWGPIPHGSGAPIPETTPQSNLTIPGATLINRLKYVSLSKIRINNGFTPGGFLDLGATQGSTVGFGMREGGPFTTGMITVTNMSRPGVFPTTTLRTETGSKNTVGGVGTIQLVQPWIIRSAGNASNGRSFTKKVLLDVPEPASILLMSSGLAGLGLIAGMRRRRG